MLSDLPNVKFEIHEKVKLSNEELSFNNLTSLDLQPIVKVNYNKKEVEITGYLVLSGEFIVKNQYWEDQLDQFDALHYDTLLNNEYKVDSFQHQIPVSIQIDNKRLEDINNVVVQVEDFDYEILSNQEIELIAQIKLIGVQPEETTDEVTIEKDFVVEQEKAVNEYDEDISEESESKSVVSESDRSEDSILVDNKVLKANENITIKPKLGITAKVDINSPDNFNPIYSLLKKEQKDFKELAESDPEENNSDGEYLVKTEDNPVSAEIVDNSLTNKVDVIDIEEDTAKVRSSSKVNKNNILYGLLHRDEPQSYKMKLYLVQKEDTIEKIADKYGLSSEDIISNNSITSNELLVGQLLYLSVKR